MARRKIYLVSPREPSGATWLINCLLELGIKTYRYSPQGMWRQEGGQWVLNPHERILRKWLPALTDHASFQFREDVEVQWTHEWFGDTHAESEVLYFVRDPRDALYSRYKREAPDLSYREFVAFPDVRTLLDKVSNWWLFNRIWLTHPKLRVFRFEDYKTDAQHTLTSVLESLGLASDATSVSRSVEASTFERAAIAERAYRLEHPEDDQIINRAGSSMGWQNAERDHTVSKRIEAVCEDLLTHFRYPLGDEQPRRIALDRHCARLGFLRHAVRSPEVFANAINAEEDSCVETLRFISDLSSDYVARARMPGHEQGLLRSSIQEYLGNTLANACAALGSTQPTVSRRPGSQLTALRQSISQGVRRLLGHRY
jgi:hypothetical protein